MELAEALNISRQAVSRWEVGIAVPSTDNLKILGDLFGVSVDYLLDDSIDAIGRKNVETCEDKFNGFEDKGVCSRHRIRYICVTVIFVLMIAIIFVLVAPDHNEEQIIPMDEMEILGENEFSTVLLPIE